MTHSLNESCYLQSVALVEICLQFHIYIVRVKPVLVSTERLALEIGIDF
jgi:hypothetical protein